MRVLTLVLAFAALPAFGFTDGEEIPAGEEAAIREVTALIRKQVEEDAKKNGRAFRDAHRKHHGCVRASFQVENSLPNELKVGLFAAGRSYSALIRYSNGSGQVQSDHDGDGRGMAVKVLGVAGPRNLHESDDEPSSQDFLMINHPVFFVRNAADYVGFQQAVASGKVLWWMLNPMRVFHEGLIARAIQKKVMVNPLDSTYFSMTASKLGTRQMKFRALPCPASRFRNPSNTTSRLAENLAATLAAGESCFLFQVQLRAKPSEMPVEDLSEEWSEKDAPFRTVARITIPRQKPSLGESCETLSFNPWNGLAEHRPLGGISRARKAVYQEISRLRHEINRQRREQPGL